MDNSRNRKIIHFEKHVHTGSQMPAQYVKESELPALAKKFRTAAGKTKVDVAREMGVKPPSVHHAEESPHLSYTKLRCRMIEAYSQARVSGPFFKIESRA